MKTFRRLIFLMSILVVAGILVACGTPGSTGSSENSTTPVLSSTSPIETSSPSAQASPTAADTEFASMLSLVPFSFLKDHDIWFGNPEKEKEVHGIQDADSLAAINQLPQEQAKQILTTLSGITIPTYGSNNFTPEFAQFFGFDVWMANRTVFPGVSPPWTFSINEGNYDAGLIASKLTGNGYRKVQYGPDTYYSFGEDFQANLNSEQAKLGVLAAMNRIALLNNTLITAPTTGIMTGILDTMSGKVLSVMDNVTCRDLAASLGDVLSGVIITPDRVVNPFPGHMSDLPPYDFTIPSDWGRLHQYDMVGMGYKDNGQERYWVISLYYSNAKDASEDAGLLASRMKSYIFNTQWKDRPGTDLKAIPLTDEFEVGQPSVQTYGSGATLTIECKYKPGTGNGAWLMPSFMTRDLLFLAPDPTPYVIGSPTPSVNTSSSATQQP